MALRYPDILSIYEGSDGALTSGLYAALEQLGPAGHVAVNVFRANNASQRAKVYRGRYKGMAYDRKAWSIENLVKALQNHAATIGVRWGWREDPEQPVHRWVFFVELPTGQVSFHTEHRLEGPDFPEAWDGVRGVSPIRICQWCAALIEQSMKAAADA